MIFQLRVRTVVVGGRPTAGPMQSVAGVEGAQVSPMNDIGKAARALVAPNPLGVRASSELAVLAEGYALLRAATVLHPAPSTGRTASRRSTRRRRCSSYTRRATAASSIRARWCMGRVAARRRRCVDGRGPVLR